MTMHVIIQQAPEAVTFRVTDEGDSFVVTAKPVITHYWFGITVGMYDYEEGSFGYWHSSNICGIMTAWRVLRILPEIKRMRNTGYGYDSTLCGLVIAMEGDRHPERMRRRAEDLDMSAEELDAELIRLSTTWPSADELCSMWDRLPDRGKYAIAGEIRAAITAGYVPADRLLLGRLEISEQRPQPAPEFAPEVGSVTRVKPGKKLRFRWPLS